jgi:hypothetical protein
MAPNLRMPEAVFVSGMSNRTGLTLLSGPHPVRLLAMPWCAQAALKACRSAATYSSELGATSPAMLALPPWTWLWSGGVRF